MDVQTNIKNKDLVSRRRKQIINAAAKLFFEKGFDQTTMREISRASGLTMGSLYDYVRSKDDILVLVYKDVIERFRLGLGGDATADRDVNPEDLELILHRSMKQMYKLSKAVQLLYRESWSRRRNVHLQMRDIERAHVETFTKLLLDGQEKGYLQVKNPTVTADLILLLVALPAIREWSFSNIDQEEVIETVTKFILRGLSAKVRT